MSRPSRRARRTAARHGGAYRRFTAESSSVAALILSDSLHVRSANRAFLRMTNLRGSIAGLPFAELLWPNSRSAMGTLFQRGAPPVRLRFLSESGTGFMVTCHAYRERKRWYLFGEQHILPESAVVRTLSQLNSELASLRADAERKARELEHALEEHTALEELRESDHRKNEFLAVLAHELRNPLAPISNSLYVMDFVEPGSERAQKALNTIKRQVAHMVRLIDDLLDVARIARGKIHIQRQHLDLNALVARTAQDMESVFATSGVALRVALPPETLTVEADPIRLAQAVGNLLGNAAKFTPRGGSTLLVLEREEGGAVVRVVDNGAGMSQEMLQNLFKPLSRADNSYSRRHGGLGLGLVLAKSLVELQGGSISACSAGLGLGTEFVVRLPVSMYQAQSETRVSASGDTGRRVLVVDDNADCAESLRAALEVDGYDVEVAYGGDDALNKARALRPEVVLCDVGMPGMDGYEVARRMRADPLLERATLVALTGYAAPEDEARSKAAGFDSHLAKPPSLARIAQAMSGRSQASSRHTDAH